jgi:GAF domain-containing protein
MIPELDPMMSARIAEEPEAASRPIRAVDEIVNDVREQLYADHAGITLIRGRQLATVASTDGLVAWADVLQYELGDGPCRDRSWQHQTLLVSDLTTDPRWPRWAPRITALGITSVLAAELTGKHARRQGSINVYWNRRRTFTANDIALVNTFARHAAVALAGSLDHAGHRSIDQTATR